MGICSSCFSSDRHAPAHSDDNESDPLLTSGQPRYGTGSGDRASNAGSEGAHTQHGPDPETLRREREEMERICARLAGSVEALKSRLPGAQRGESETNKLETD